MNKKTPLQIKSNTATQVGEQEAHFDVLYGALVSLKVHW